VGICMILHFSFPFFQMSNLQYVLPYLFNYREKKTVNCLMWILPVDCLNYCLTIQTLKKKATTTILLFGGGNRNCAFVLPDIERTEQPAVIFRVRCRRSPPIWSPQDVGVPCAKRERRWAVYLRKYTKNRINRLFFPHASMQLCKMVRWMLQTWWIGVLEDSDRPLNLRCFFNCVFLRSSNEGKSFSFLFIFWSSASIRRSGFPVRNAEYIGAATTTDQVDSFRRSFGPV
jgi:hypothetical protein